MGLYLLVAHTVSLLHEPVPIELLVHVEVAVVDSRLHNVFLDYVLLRTQVRLSIVDQEVAADAIVLLLEVNLSDSPYRGEGFRVFVEL